MAASVSMCVRQAMKIPRLTQSLVFHNPARCSRIPMTTTTTATTGEAEEKETKTEEISAADKQLMDENETLQKQIVEMKDKYLRSLAETENVRRRMKKQVDDAKIFGIQGFCKDLLDVADILGKATETVPKDQIKTNVHLKSLFEGLTMTESQLQKVFLKHGLSQIVPKEGEKFDPFFHEALFQVPTSDKASGGVAVLQKLGYKLHERTLRPALVGVFKSSSS